MLNPFPELLVFGIFAPFIIRIVLGVLFACGGYLKLTKDKEEKVRMFEDMRFPSPRIFVLAVGIIELIGGIVLFVGFFTQIAAAALAILVLGTIILKYRKPEAFKNTIAFYILLFVASLSLILSGAGAFAIDLPL